MAGKQVGYRLTPGARVDLESIWKHGAATWSADQADRYLDEMVRTFELLALMPAMGREHPGFTPKVRIHPHGSHLVIYTTANDGVDVIRVLGARQDWRAILGGEG